MAVNSPLPTTPNILAVIIEIRVVRTMTIILAALVCIIVWTTPLPFSSLRIANCVIDYLPVYAVILCPGE
ncbi:hypothetical protein D3C76_1370380 [compost metagenome]